MQEMTMTFHTPCAFSGEADLQAMVDVLVRARPADRTAEYPGIADLQEMLVRPPVQVNTSLWYDVQGRLVGYALIDEFNNLLFDVLPKATGQGLETQMIAWGVERIRQTRQPDGEPLTLDAGCREDDVDRLALLEQHGFVRQPVDTMQFVHPLDGPIPDPQLPPGFSIRHVEGEHEAGALVALHRAAFGTEKLTVEGRLSWMQIPEYDPALDLVVVAPDGRLAAYCMCRISQEENARTGRNEGWTDPIGTHPDFRRRGLVRALLLTGMRLLKQRGMEAAVLGTGEENVAMQRAAMSVGFHVQWRKHWFAKPVSEASNA
jgi:ribosomal protein S18 acetylase RimI-like enzyme